MLVGYAVILRTSTACDHVIIHQGAQISYVIVLRNVSKRIADAAA